MIGLNLIFVVSSQGQSRFMATKGRVTAAVSLDTVRGMARTAPQLIGSVV
jgi:hypothetical protein